MSIWYIWWFWALYGVGVILWAIYVPLIPKWLRYTSVIFGSVQILVNVTSGLVFPAILK